MRYRSFGLVSAVATFIAISMPNLLQAQTINQSALDYHVGFATKDALTLGSIKAEGYDRVTVVNVTNLVASYFFKAQANLDDVVNAQDTYDHIRVFAAASIYPNMPRFAAFDLDRDGVTTQQELEVANAKKTWITASAVFKENRSYEDVRAYFEELIAKRTRVIREAGGVEADVDLDATGTKLIFREDVDQLLDQTNFWGPPYFIAFDIDQDASVTFAEFFKPVAAAVASSDTDGDGIFSETELKTIIYRFGVAEKRFEGKEEGLFSFPDPR